MRPDFEYMTIAELQTYVSYIHKVARESFKVLKKINAHFEEVGVKNNSKLQSLNDKTKQIMRQFEVLGLSSENNT